MRILFEDQNLISVFKPAGSLSVPSNMGKKDPRPVVGIQLQEQIQKPIFPLHRLDLEVAGILAFAKTSQVQKEILDLWEQGKVQKTYRALTYHQNFSHWPENVSGALKDSLTENLWVSWIVAGKKRSFIGSHGQKSITRWKQVETNSEFIQWELEPVTGRRHQLRLELSRRGFPIWGDQLYGSTKTSPEGGIALVAVGLEIPGFQKLQLDWSWAPWIQ
jgi:23S rRNA-/tRNA-specific pseudouridylate synthase